MLDPKCSRRQRCTVSSPDAALKKLEEMDFEGSSFMLSQFACINPRSAASYISSPLKRCLTSDPEHRSRFWCWDFMTLFLAGSLTEGRPLSSSRWQEMKAVLFRGHGNVGKAPPSELLMAGARKQSGYEKQPFRAFFSIVAELRNEVSRRASDVGSKQTSRSAFASLIRGL